MSKRIDITNQIFNDFYVLEYYKQINSHAKWKCLCMSCNEITYVTYTNLISGNSKSCQSCGQKIISNGVEQDIVFDIDKGDRISQISKKYNVDRGVIYRIKKQYNK